MHEAILRLEETCARACTHARIRQSTHNAMQDVHIQACLHARMHAQTYARMHVRTHLHTPAHTPIRPHRCTPARNRAQKMHAHTRAHMHPSLHACTKFTHARSHARSHARMEHGLCDLTLRGLGAAGKVPEARCVPEDAGTDSHAQSVMCSSRPSRKCSKLQLPQHRSD